MAIHRTFGRVFLTLMAPAMMSGCDYIMTCSWKEPNEGQSLFNQKRIDLDIWVVKTVDGASKPAAGWPIPLHDTENFLSGSLKFKTTRVIGGCKDASKETGVVTAQFLLATKTGSPKFPGKSYAGTFEHDLKTGEVTLRAPAETKPNKYGVTSVDGIVNGNTMTFTAGIPYVASATIVLQK
jgi:hypothetical protein